MNGVHECVCVCVWGGGGGFGKGGCVGCVYMSHVKEINEKRNESI